MPAGYDLFVLWLTALPVLCSPGPANLSLAGVGMNHGFVRGLPYLVGIILGTTGVLAMVASGLTAIILSQPVLTNLLAILASLYLLYIAWLIASAPVGNPSGFAAKTPRMLPGLILSLANPKAFAAISALYLGQQALEVDDIQLSLVIFSVLASGIVISGFSWLTLGTLFSGILKHPRIGRTVNICFAVMLIVSVTYPYIL